MDWIDPTCQASCGITIVLL